MFYATRTQQITGNVTEKQALSFYTKAQRDAYCHHMGAKPITAAEHKKLQPACTRRSVTHPNIGVFFVHPVMA